MSFCDARQMFISENADYLAYMHIMTPDSRLAGAQLGVAMLQSTRFDPQSLQ